jgi:hypothetical protein
VAGVVLHAALRRHVARGGAAAERVAGGRPAAEVASLEVLEDVTRGRRVRALDIVGRERRAVDVADEVLRAGAAGDAAGVDVDDQDPLGLAAVEPEGEQIRHPQAPATSFAGPKSLMCVHDFRFGEL